MSATLPSVPEPVQIELEFTNACNARCTACPRDDMPPKGLASRETIDAILDGYDLIADSLALNRASGSRIYPTMTVAGGGDPFLHPYATDLLAHVSARGRPVHVITNASRLSPERIDRLVESGISSIVVSFWGIHRQEYEAAMRLPYDATLARVELLAARAREAGIPVCVVWVRVPEITSSPDEVLRFWSDRGIDVDLDDNYEWNRGGLLRRPMDPVALAIGSTPDPARGIWCADYFFSDSYRWNGDAVMCCCCYFTSTPVRFGNIHTDGLAAIRARKAASWHARPLAAMCQSCVLPRRLRTEWLAAPWLPLLGEDDRAELLGDPVGYR